MTCLGKSSRWDHALQLLQHHHQKKLEVDLIVYNVAIAVTRLIFCHNVYVFVYFLFVLVFFVLSFVIVWSLAAVSLLLLLLLLLSLADRSLLR